MVLKTDQRPDEQSAGSGDDLENLYNSASARDSDLPPNHPSRTNNQSSAPLSPEQASALGASNGNLQGDGANIDPGMSRSLSNNQAAYDDDPFNSSAASPGVSSSDGLMGSRPDYAPVARDNTGMTQAAHKRTARPSFGGEKSGASYGDLAATKQGLAEKEASGESGEESNAETKEKGKIGKATEGWKTSVGKVKNKKSRSKKKIAAFLGGGVGALFVVLVMLFFLANSLKIANLAENISTWQFARTARLMRINSSRVNATKANLDAVDDSRYGKLKTKYEGLRGGTWGRLDKYRPQKVFENLRTTNVIEYKYSEPKGVFRRTQLQAVVIDGNEIPVAEKSRFNPIFNSSERARFSSAVERSLETSLKDYKSLVRGKTMKLIRESAGVKLRWYDKKGNAYRDLTPEEADRKLLADSKENIAEEPRKGSSIPGVDEATDAGEEATDECLKDPECARKVRGAKGASFDVPEINNPIDEAIDAPNLTTSTLSTASTVYAIASPLCVIYEGSIASASSAESIDAQSDAALKTYYSVATAYHQQKTGEVSAEAVGAMNRKLGDIGPSAAVKQSKGELAEPTVLSAQSSALGEFTAFDALLGGDSSIADAAEVVVDNLCPILLEPAVAVGVAGAEFGASIYGCVTSACAQEALEQGLKAQVRLAIRKTMGNLVSKSTLKRVLGEAAATASATIITKMLVMSQMNANFNGLGADEVYADQALVGGAVLSEETNRTHFYGAPITREDYLAQRSTDREDVAYKEGQKSVYERYASTSNPNSLLARTAISTSSALQPKKIGANLASYFKNFFANLSSLFASGFGFDKVFAQEYNGVINAGVVPWDWTAEEQALIDSDATYQMLENEFVLEQIGEETFNKIKSEYEPCYTKSMGQLLKDGDVVRNENGDVVEDQGKCSPKNLGPNNEEFGDNVFRWRLKNSYDNSLQHLDDIANPTQGNTPAASTTSEGPRPTGTVPIEETAETTGGGGIRVHKSIVAKVDEMLAAAAADGVNLTGGGWRDGETQIRLRKEHCGTSQFDIYEKRASLCRPPTARPGSSNHERGLAIDFNNCSSRGTACFQWLAGNAERFGFKNLPSEPWHWSVDGK